MNLGHTTYEQRGLDVRYTNTQLVAAAAAYRCPPCRSCRIPSGPTGQKQIALTSTAARRRTPRRCSTSCAPMVTTPPSSSTAPSCTASIGCWYGWCWPATRSVTPAGGYGARRCRQCRGALVDLSSADRDPGGGAHPPCLTRPPYGSTARGMPGSRRPSVSAPRCGRSTRATSARTIPKRSPGACWPGPSRGRSSSCTTAVALAGPPSRPFPRSWPRLRKRGYQMVTVSQLLASRAG